MPDPGKKKKPVSLNKHVTQTRKKALHKLKKELERDGRDFEAVTEFRLNQISPENAKRLGDAVQDAMIDQYGPSAKGYSIPVDLFLDLPDQSRLKVNVDPNTKSFSVMFGMQL